VVGTGLDIVETGRMQEMLDRWGARFKDRVFTPGEQAYCEATAFPCRHYAGRWAVKEAVAKAFGTGFGPALNWLDIDVVRNASSGAPSVRLGERGRRLAEARGIVDILVSLSHARHYAVAHALLTGRARAGNTPPGRE
jgi:holo-[acyl-carrier protein] synthase